MATAVLGATFGNKKTNGAKYISPHLFFIARPKRAKRATKAKKAVVSKVSLWLRTAAEYIKK